MVCDLCIYLRSLFGEIPLTRDPHLVTFLKLDLKRFDVALDVGKTMVQLFLQDGVKFDYNDLAGNQYKKITEIRIPAGVLRGLLNPDTSTGQWFEAGSVFFDLAMDTYSSPAFWEDMARKQKDFISSQDSLTRRVWYLYESPGDHPASRTSGRPRNRACWELCFIKRQLLIGYAGGIHLPQPALPGMRRSGRNVSTASQHHKHQQPSLTRRGAVDSDEDERMTEADRDARLA